LPKKLFKIKYHFQFKLKNSNSIMPNKNSSQPELQKKRTARQMELVLAFDTVLLENYVLQVLLLITT
jgi:hypothetical protein